jgi:hypothetical protein
LNEGDVFVLDAGKNIFVWVGKEAGLVKQSKGLEIANMINSENKGTPSPPACAHRRMRSFIAFSSRHGFGVATAGSGA